jgi:bifunctional isochorismate lyase/aryl carrier protein
MTLPAITPYPLPTAADLPAGRVDWRVDPARAVLLVHDMQRHFVDAFTPGADPIAGALANIGRLRKHCADAGIPVVYSAQPADQPPAERGLLQDFWGDGVRGAAAAEILPELAPEAGDVVVTKRRYSALYRTELADLLAERGRDQLVICGIYGHIGCVATACDAFMRDIQPFLVADAIADFSAQDHRDALRYAAARCARVLTTDDLIGAGPSGLEEIRAQVAALLDPEDGPLGVDDDLLDRGLDSIRVMTLVQRWRAAGMEVSFADLAEEPTVRAWWSLLSEPPA